MDIREQGGKKYELLGTLTYLDLLNMVGGHVWVEYNPDIWVGYSVVTDGLEEVVDNGEGIDLLDWNDRYLGCVQQQIEYGNIIVYNTREVTGMKRRQLQGVLVARDGIIDDYTHLQDILEAARMGYSHTVDMGDTSHFLLLTEEDKEFISGDTTLVDRIVYGDDMIDVTPIERLLELEQDTDNPFTTVVTIYCERVID